MALMLKTPVTDAIRRHGAETAKGKTGIVAPVAEDAEFSAALALELLDRLLLAFEFQKIREVFFRRFGRQRLQDKNGFDDRADRQIDRQKRPV